MPVSPKPGKASEDEQIRIGWQMAGLGFEVAAMVIGAAGVGWLFDRWRGTAPNGILIASLVGIVVALTTLVRGTLRLNRRLEAIAPTGTYRTTGAKGSEEPEAEPDDWDRRWKDKWGDDDADDNEP